MVEKPRKILSSARDESGSIMFYILLGVILFAALSFTVARGMRSQNTSVLGKQQLKIAVSDVMDYAQKADQAVQSVLRKGCSENEISFESESWGNTDYEHVVSVEEKCKVFASSGGGLQWRAAPVEYVPVNAQWGFDSHIAIKGVESDPPSAGSPYGGELVMTLKVGSKALCMAINDGLGIKNSVDDAADGTRPPYDPAVIDMVQPFKGDFSADVILSGQDNQLVEKAAGCVTSDGTKNSPKGPYVFYYTLVAR